MKTAKPCCGMDLDNHEVEHQKGIERVLHE